MHTHVKATLTFASEKLRTNSLIVFNSRSQKTITRDHYFGKWADGRINNLDLIPFLHAVNTVYTCIITNLNSDSPLVAKVNFQIQNNSKQNKTITYSILLLFLWNNILSNQLVYTKPIRQLTVIVYSWLVKYPRTGTVRYSCSEKRKTFSKHNTFAY